MPDLKFYKEIGSVPEVLTPDSLYTIRTGPGFDLYVSDTTGSVAYKINHDSSAMQIAGDLSDFTTALNTAINN